MIADATWVVDHRILLDGAGVLLWITKLSIDQLSLHATSVPTASNNKVNDAAVCAMVFVIWYLALKVLTELLHAVGRFVANAPVKFGLLAGILFGYACVLYGEKFQFEKVV